MERGRGANRNDRQIVDAIALNQPTFGSQPMSTVEISLRLSGMLPSSEQLRKLFDVEPTIALRQGEQVSKRRVQPVDLWVLELAKFDHESSQQNIENQLIHAASVIEQLASAIATLDRTQCQADLYISTIREEDQGGFALSPVLIAAAATAQLTVQVSILVMLDDYENSGLRNHELSTSALS